MKEHFYSKSGFEEHLKRFCGPRLKIKNKNNLKNIQFFSIISTETIIKRNSNFGQRFDVFQLE
jgi:hypothetical protein